MTHVFVILCLTIKTLIFICTAVWGQWAVPAYFQSKRILPFGFTGQSSSISFLCCFHAATWYVIALFVVGDISSPWGADASSHVLRDDPCYCFFCFFSNWWPA